MQNFLELRLNHWISQLPPHQRIKTIWYLLIKIHPESSKIIYCAKAKIHVKSHGVQINTDPRKILIWNKTLPWELFEARTATERFFTVDKYKYKYLVICLQNGNQMKWLSQINPDPRNILILGKASMGALWHVWKQHKNFHRKAFHSWEKIQRKLWKTKLRITPVDPLLTSILSCCSL